MRRRDVLRIPFFWKKSTPQVNNVLTLPEYEGLPDVYVLDHIRKKFLNDVLDVFVLVTIMFALHCIYGLLTYPGPLRN